MVTGTQRIIARVEQRQYTFRKQPAGSDEWICVPPSHGARLDALRPACATCSAIGIGEWARTAASVRASAASFASE